MRVDPSLRLRTGVDPSLALRTGVEAEVEPLLMLRARVEAKAEAWVCVGENQRLQRMEKTTNLGVAIWLRRAIGPWLAQIGRE